MGLVVDTSALVDLERAGAAALWTEVGGHPVVLPAIVLAELLVGVRLATDPRRAELRRARVDALRARIPVVPFDDRVAEQWADLFAELQDAGAPIPANDMAVSATARALGWGVLVGRRDEAHFRRVDGLEVHVLDG